MQQKIPAGINAWCVPMVNHPEHLKQNVERHDPFKDGPSKHSYYPYEANNAVENGFCYDI